MRKTILVWAQLSTLVFAGQCAAAPQFVSGSMAGIAKPAPFFEYLQSGNDVVMVFPDHHHFSESDILNIKNRANGKIIVTTEKDFVRLEAEILAAQLYFLPIKSQIMGHSDSFDQIILDYVGARTGNR